MPGPPITKPAWADPAQASVFDSPAQKAARMLGGLLGGSDQGADAIGALSPMTTIATVPREAVESLVPRLLKAWTDRYGQVGQAVPDAVTEAVQTLAQRFPRAMSHVQAVEPYAGRSTVRGQFVPMPADWNGRAGVIQLNPNQTPEQLLQALTHELTHTGQQLRAVSRGSDLDALYSAFPEQYFTNPFEVRARTAQINQALRRGALVDSVSVPMEPRAPGARLQIAKEHAMNPFADEWMKR